MSVDRGYNCGNCGGRVEGVWDHYSLDTFTCKPKPIDIDSPDYKAGFLEGYKHGYAAGELIGESREREAQIDRDLEDRTRGE